MACPLFIPTSPLGELAAGATPLGDLYCGCCKAEPMAAIEPETLRRYCNFGYGRGHCPRAAQSDADAARFMIRAAQGSVVEIAWALERNHHPVAVGRIEIDTAGYRTADEDTLTCQAGACARAYMRQTRIAAAAHR